MMSDKASDLNEHKFLADLLEGKLDVSDPEVQRRLEESPQLRARYDDMNSIDADLQAVGEVVRAHATNDVPEVDIDGLVQSHQRRASRARHKRWGLVAAIAAGIFVAIGLSTTMTEETDPNAGNDPMLGGEELGVAHPIEQSLERGQRFLWIAIAGADYYRVQVVDTNEVDVLPESVETTEPEWLPSEDEFSKIPARFRWRVRAYDGSDRLLRMTAWFEASRSTR